MRKNILVSAGVGVTCLFAGMALAAPQPHMEAALASLRDAQQQILLADQFHDHGGHAGSATHLIDEAIKEVQRGIDYRDEHGR
jgi:hypothetical protein